MGGGLDLWSWDGRYGYVMMMNMMGQWATVVSDVI